MKSRYISKAIFASLLLLSISFASFGQMPGGVKKVTSVEGITEYQLKNGMKVLLFPDQTKQTITVNVTYLVGSRHENYGETGMAHLLEHLVFKGSTNHKNISEELSSHGAQANGTTWLDRTNYYETFNASDENLKWALEMESDRMVNSFIAKKDLESEFSVVRNEMESGENSPFRVLFQKTMANAFIWHNYGKSTIGARSDVENVPINNLKAFYKRFYQPDNAVLIVAGKFDEAKTIAMIDKTFGAIPRPTRVLKKNYTVEPVQDGERTVTIRRKGDIKLVMAGYHTPPGAHKDAAAVDVFNTIMSDTPSGRLYKNLVETKKAVGVLGFNLQTNQPGFHLLGAQVAKNDKLKPVADDLLSTIEQTADKSFTKEEVNRAKTILLKNIELAFNDPNSVGIQLSEWIALGDWRLFFLHRDRLRKVTVADVQNAADKYYKRSNRTLGMFVPTEKPNRAEIPLLGDSDVAIALKGYKGDAMVAAGEAFDPSTKNIEMRTRRMSNGGVKMAFLTKENRGDTVVARINFRFGDEKSLMNRSQAAGFAGQMLMRGTTKHTRQQIQDEFDRLKAHVNVSGSATGVRASIQTTRQNLPAVLKLVAEIMREPAFPASEFDTMKRQAITGTESQRSNPRAVAIQAMSKHFNTRPKGHPNYARSFDEQIADIKATTLDDVKKFYKDFYGASTGEISIIGDFDDKQIEPLTKSLFGNWKSPGNYKRISNNFNEVKMIDKNIETPDKQNAFFVARINVNMRDDNPDYPALFVGNYMFGGGFLNSRFLTRIRQKDGISYGGGSQLGVRSIDPSGAFLAFAIYAPENVGKLEIGFKDEIAKIIKDGFTDKEITDAKKGLIQTRQLARANDGRLAGSLNSYLYLNRTLDWDADFESKVQSLTKEQINAAFKKYITPENISLFKAGDFAKAKEKAKNADTGNKMKKPLTSGKYADLVGTYTGPQIGTVEISEKDGKLFATPPGSPPLELKPVKDKTNEFTAQFGGQGSVGVKFVKTDSGTVLSLNIGGNTISAKKDK